MYLRSVRVENYRSIREAHVTFDSTTVLIGENDSGITSILEALMLLVGDPSEVFEAQLRPVHFHLAGGELRIILHISEDEAGTWTLPASLRPLAKAAPPGACELDFEFRAQLDPSTQQISESFFVSFGSAPGSSRNCGKDVLEWVRRLIPVLWLRAGLLTPAWVPANSLPETTTVARDPTL